MAVLLYLVVAGISLLAVRRAAHVPIVACFALLLLPLLPTARAIFTGGVYGPVDLAYSSEPLQSVATAAGIRNLGNPSLSDGYAQTIPWYTAARRSLSNRHWPLWNPFEFCGGILLAAVQSAPFHPIHVLSYMLPPPDARTFIATATFFLAALSMFLFAKELTGSDSASLIAAAGWMLSSHLVFFVVSALGTSTAVLPLLLLAAGRVALRPGFTSGMFLVGALTLLVLAGHSEAMLQLVSLGFVWFLFVLLGSRKAIREAIVTGTGAGLATLFLCAVMIVPHIEALTQTEEFQSRAKKVVSTSRTSFASMRHQVLSSLLPFIDGQPGVEIAHHPPDVRHDPVAFAYAGALLFGPAVYSLALLQRRRDVRFFSVLLLFGILVGIRMPGLIDLFNHLPGFSLAVNDRMLCFAALSIVALAAIGLEEWSRDASTRMAAALLMVGLSIAVVMIVIGPDLMRRGLHLNFIRVHATRAVLPLIIAGVAALHHSRRFGVTLFLALLLVQRGGETARMQSTVRREAFYPRFAGLELMTSPQPPSRVVGVGTFFPPNTATMYGLEDARGFQAMTLSRYTDMVPFWSTPQPVWSNRVDDLSAPFLSLMNVRWAIAAPTTLIPDGWQVRLRTPTYSIVENLRVLPRAFAPAMVHLGATDSDRRAIGRCRNFAAEAWIESRDPRTDQPNGSGGIRTIRDGNRLLLDAQMNAPGWVVVTESAWKGWRAAMDGRWIPVRIANHAFLALYLPSGNHHVMLEYRPRSFVIALISSMLTALALAGLGISRSFRTSDPRPQP